LAPKGKKLQLGPFSFGGGVLIWGKGKGLRSRQRSCGCEFKKRGKKEGGLFLSPRKYRDGEGGTRKRKGRSLLEPRAGKKRKWEERKLARMMLGGTRTKWRKEDREQWKATLSLVSREDAPTQLTVISWGVCPNRSKGTGERAGRSLAHGHRRKGKKRMSRAPLNVIWEDSEREKKRSREKKMQRIEEQLHVSERGQTNTRQKKEVEPSRCGPAIIKGREPSGPTGSSCSHYLGREKMKKKKESLLSDRIIRMCHWRKKGGKRARRSGMGLKRENKEKGLEKGPILPDSRRTTIIGVKSLGEEVTWTPGSVAKGEGHRGRTDEPWGEARKIQSSSLGTKVSRELKSKLKGIVIG